MKILIIGSQYRLDVDRAFSAWRGAIESIGEVDYPMPTVGTAPDGRLLYPDMPEGFLEVLRREKIPFEEARGPTS
jgi:hypothetical protein